MWRATVTAMSSLAVKHRADLGCRSEPNVAHRDYDRLASFAGLDYNSLSARSAIRGETYPCSANLPPIMRLPLSRQE